MKIHKEGYSIILITALILFAVILFTGYFTLGPAFWIVIVAAVLLLAFVTAFFRYPSRNVLNDAAAVFSPADGTIVAIEEVEEKEFFQDRRRLVSVFMSIWNVHINWFPVAGEIEYFRHHHGRFLVAWHPKSSEDNERTTTVVNTGREKILFRQIAGLVARRIVSYAHVGHAACQNKQCGFIKFGSRVDIYLPLDAEVNVKLGQKVKGTQTVIAKFNRD